MVFSAFAINWFFLKDWLDGDFPVKERLLTVPLSVAIGWLLSRSSVILGERLPPVVVKTPNPLLGGELTPRPSASPRSRGTVEVSRLSPAGDVYERNASRSPRHPTVDEKDHQKRKTLGTGNKHFFDCITLYSIMLFNTNTAISPCLYRLLQRLAL